MFSHCFINWFKVHGNIYNRPIILSKPRPTGKDDLKQIEGINLKTEEDLNQLGIFHFDQISKWSKKNCDWVNEYLALENRIKDENWVEQATVLTNKK
jgi:predicted flap endonuclease-1-like 5' DNA nuclease